MQPATQNWTTRSATYTTTREFYQQRKQEMSNLRKSGKTLQEIANIYEISKERVRQVVGNTKDFHYVTKARKNRILDPIYLNKTDQELADELGHSVDFIRHHRSGIRRKLSPNSALGMGSWSEDRVSEILTINRIQNTKMPHTHPFDILLANGKRIDVKVSAKPMHPPSQYAPFYHFQLGKKRRGEYADFFILVPLKDGEICNLYIVPNDVLPVGLDYLRIPTLPDEQRKTSRRSKYEAYKNRFDLLR